MKTPAGASWARYDESNRAAAEIILADIGKHGGGDALAVEWAKRFMKRSADQGQLFVRKPAGSCQMVFGC
jgi:hypothetical protein